MSLPSTSSKELCVACLTQPYDLTCTCGDKFDFTCIHLHVAQIRLEFEYTHGETGERLLQVEHIVESTDCNSAKTIIENWRQKRIQEINEIAVAGLNEIQHRENAYLDVPSFRTQFDALGEQSNRVVHEQLDSIHSLQRRIVEKFDQLKTLPELHQDDTSLDTELQSKLNPNLLNPNSTTHVTESIISASVMPLNTTTSTTTEQPIVTQTTYIEQPRRLVNNDHMPNSTMDAQERDDFDAGQTVNIARQSLLTIPITHDNYMGTICCYNNQLLYNDYNHHTRTSHLILIPNLKQPTTRETIDWSDPDRMLGDGDDQWIQDIAYSTKLQGYLVLNRSRLRILYDNGNQLQEFHEFPNRSMKRVTCDNTYIYLISAADTKSHNSDEIIIMNYDKEEKVRKTLRDIVLTGRNDMALTYVGEISDLAISPNGQIMLAYRVKLRRQVRVCVFIVSDDRNNWTLVKQLLLNECWNDDVSYTPRVEWCEKLHVFFLVEYITSHLIMLDETGQVKGECRFVNVQNRRESPLNLTISTNDTLCVRYESSINVHQLINDRL
ncbi:unnamed protein product [Rotaria sordida]|uniref:Uncharacterized protein n=1 Tax=Rotaria sordida TaxID=392033 RepID=A0A814FD83_9BILA|nr:unnamed protein product [Rotaria sordida]CAF1190949.1 unnamed protein product [Rotaria sordida]